MLFKLQTLLRLLKNGDYHIISQAYPVVALTGSAGYLLFFFIDRAFGYYENIFLRIITAVIFLQIMFLNKKLTGLKIFLLELIFAICLPLFYSYFYFCTGQKISWGVGFVFGGFTYGFLSGRILYTVTIFPMFAAAGFFLYDIFFQKTGMQTLADGTGAILFAVFAAFFSAIVKMILESILVETINIEGRQRRIIRDKNVRIRQVDVENLEKDLNKIKRLDALSKLTGGLFNDFAEMTDVISKKSLELRNHYVNDDDKRMRIDTVRDLARKASSKINSIAVFAPDTFRSIELVDINSIVNKLVVLLREIDTAGIVIKSNLHAVNTVIMGNPDMLEQAFVNICINAFHAMPEGGVLEVRTENRSERDGATVLQQVEISFTDTGCGMDKETQERIFTPFFSTKGKGRGSGLGLVMVKETIMQHNGRITVDSNPGKGTAFTILLPSVL